MTYNKEILNGLRRLKKEMYLDCGDLFINEKFNRNNFNSGEDILKLFFNKIEKNEIDNKFIIEIDNYCMICIFNITQINDVIIATIILNNDTYLIKWDKLKLKIKNFYKNGIEIVEYQYIDILNVINKIETLNRIK